MGTQQQNPKKNKKRIDPHRPAVQFQPEDKVAIKNHKVRKGLSLKLHTLFNPGYTVVERISDLLCKVADPHRNNKVQQISNG